MGHQNKTENYTVVTMTQSRLSTASNNNLQFCPTCGHKFIIDEKARINRIEWSGKQKTKYYCVNSVCDKNVGVLY